MGTLFPLFSGRDSLPPAPRNDVRWYRIASGSQPYPILATAKINPFPGQNQDKSIFKYLVRDNK